MEEKTMKLKKQILGFLLAAAMFATVPLVANAANSRIDGFGDMGLEEAAGLGQSLDFNDISIMQGEEIRIPLTAGMFSWSDTLPLDNEAVTVHQLRSGRVKVRARKIYGGKTLDYVQLDTDTFESKDFYRPGTTVSTARTAYISVMMTREFIGVKDTDFQFDIYLSVDGERSERHCLTLTGTFLVEDVEVYKDTDYVNMAEGVVAKAAEYVPRVDLDTGNGLTINTRLEKDKRYYATSKIVDSHAEMKKELDYLPDLYPEIECIYKLETVNVFRSNPSRTTIVLPGNKENTVFHVYSEDLRYLGTTADKLAYSPMYILTTVRMPVLEEIEYSNVTREEPVAREKTEEKPGNVMWAPKAV